MEHKVVLDQIRSEITQPFYQQNFPNDGTRFVAWYLRRVLRCDTLATKDSVTDGPDDKQIDAIIINDDERRILIVQGKFINGTKVDGEPLREVLTAWARLNDLPSLQKECNDKLKQKLEAVRQAIDDEYDLEFELLTTGELTTAARGDLKGFAARLEETNDLSATLRVVDADLIRSRLLEADTLELPSLNHSIAVAAEKTLATNVNGATTIVTLLPLTECLKLPGITDGHLFRKNVRQSLGMSNKVNRGLRDTLNGDRVNDFFFYHNGVTALCDSIEISEDRTTLHVKGLSVVNGCQSLTTIYSSSERVRSVTASGACVLFRLYEIPNRAQGDNISVNTNSQSAVKPRDLRSNDRVMVGLKRAYETHYSDGYMLTKRGEERPADKDANKTVDVAALARMLMAWHCQRPNVSYNEKRLFDEHYKVLFRTGYKPESILALQTWLNAIDVAWPNLTMNDVLKAGRSWVKYHILFSISALISHLNGQTQSVPDPALTIRAAQHAGDLLPLAATCLDTALNAAYTSAQGANKVFSPQNWLKRIESVNGEVLVAGTLAGVLGNLPNGPALKELCRVPANGFQARWSAD